MPFPIESDIKQRGWAHFRQKLLKLSESTLISVKVETSAVVSCFLQKFLVFALVFLFFALVSCFVHLFLGGDHMRKYLSNSTKKLVFRKRICCVPVRLQIPAVWAHFEGLRNLLNFKKFLKNLNFRRKKLYFERRIYDRIFVGLKWKVDG